MAIPQQIMPAMEPPLLGSFVVASAIILIINPKPAKGMLIQLRAPRHGIKAVNIPRIAKIPQIKLNVCILPPNPINKFSFLEHKL